MNLKKRMEYYKLGGVFSESEHLECLSEYKPKYLYQYKAGYDYDIKNLHSEDIWLSLPLYLNDPFEYEYGVYSHGILISCFTERSDSMLMWSHYSNGHQGYCLKYNFNDIYSKFESNLYPIIYSKERFKPTLTETGNTNEIINTFIHKAYEWRYEQEWRVFKLIPINRKKLNNIQINKGECIKGPKPVEIIMGCCSNYDLRYPMAEYCKNNNILLSRMSMKDSKYKLYKKILPFDLFEPSEVNLDKIMKEYLKTDAAKKDLKIMKKQNEEAEKQHYARMKDFL